MYNDTLLTIRTTLHRYIICRSQIAAMRSLSSDAAINEQDERGRPIISSELGTLLDQEDLRGHDRCHALVVGLRRRTVALLVHRIEDAHIGNTTIDMIQPLPPLLARSLERPWFMGVLLRDDEPILVLDIRRIAQDVVLAHKQQNTLPISD
jgi:chemotaxis signal transduction protein